MNQVIDFSACLMFMVVDLHVKPSCYVWSKDCTREKKTKETLVSLEDKIF